MQRFAVLLLLSACKHGGATGLIAPTGFGEALPADQCSAGSLLSSLGKNHLLFGATMQDTTAAKTPFDLRYIYLSGQFPNGDGPCSSCASGCSTGSSSCDNAHGCNWWGCWQYDQDPPGAYVRNFIQTAKTDGQIPWFTYYMVLQASGLKEGTTEVSAWADPTFAKRYFDDFRFLLQQIGQDLAFVHLEPDFWGYAEQSSSNPHAIGASVQSANASDCSSQENSLAGYASCLVAMARKYAPNVKIGLHGSGWATNVDVLQNTDPGLDVKGEAQKLAAFLTAAGVADTDFIAVDASDRDAGYYATQGKITFWDATNAKLPSFTQAFTWVEALSNSVQKPNIWWQVPVGNMSLPNQTNAWQDNRVDYFFSHLGDVVHAQTVAVAFGAGADGQTTPESDQGNLTAHVTEYAAMPQSVCQ